MVAEIWSELLGRQPSDRDANFFASGGDSLSAIRLVAEIEKRTDARMSFDTVFQAPTVADLDVRKAT